MKYDETATLTHFLGTKIVVNKNDITGKMIINNEIPEEESFRIFIKNIHENSIVIDIGACYGQYSLICAKMANKGKVIAIEPNPYHFSMLKKGIELNNLNNIIPLNIALSDYVGTSKLYISNKHPEGTSLYEEKINDETGKDSSKSIIEVKINTLDILLSQLHIQHNNVNIIKLDSEGAEMKILRGANKTLTESKNLKLLTEFGHDSITSSNENPKKFLQLLIDRFHKIEVIELNTLLNKDNIDIHSNIICKNLFCQ